MKEHLTLAIETSCDETAAAVYHSNKGALSNELFSQTDLHQQYGGVVPEIASRSHIEKIHSIVQKSLNTAHCTLDDITGIAVTTKPGLAGSLLVGTCFAKALAYARNLPIIGINHLEGHVYSGMIEQDIPFPFLCLAASGGHTSMYLVHDFGEYEVIGTTLDDAAGEAFDKIAKLLNLGYPGGPIIEKLGLAVDFKDFFKYPRLRKKNLNFSFSGLKTAVLYDLVERQAYDLTNKILLDTSIELQQKVSSSLLNCVADIFVDRLKIALKKYPNIQAISFVGGVACNTFIGSKITNFATSKGLQCFIPSREYCTDNAAMIGFVGNYRLQRGEKSDMTLDIG